MLYHSLLLLVIVVNLSTAQVVDSGQHQPTPELTCLLDASEYTRRVDSYYGSDSLHNWLRSFRGLVIELFEEVEYYPFLPYIFFDAGSADFASRYKTFDHDSAVEAFNVVQIPGGTVQKHHQVLNILGFRMRRDLNTTITLTGCNSQQPDRGETRELSLKRAANVRDYLVRRWGIESKRIRIEARDLPKYPSDNRVEPGREENRRVEIVSSDWEIMQIVTGYDLRRFPQPEVVHFGLKNGIADEEVAFRRIEIRRGDELWHVMGDSILGLTKSQSPGYNWGRWGNEDSIPMDESPYIAQLVVLSKSGAEYRSKEVEIPVAFAMKSVKIRETISAQDYDRFTLLVFPYNTAQIDTASEYALRLFVCDQMSDSARIHVTGYADGLESGEMKLSTSRAKEVVKTIRRNLKKGMTYTIDDTAVGDTSPLYSSDSPEGRCLNRTVQVIVGYRYGSRRGKY
jgi:outer membrane protein OmpA-like peptidoglycan-associated protein